VNTPIRTLGTAKPDKKTTEYLLKLNNFITRLHDLHIVHQEIGGHLESENPVREISERVHDKLAAKLENDIEKILEKLYTKQLNAVPHEEEDNAQKT
jgi:hypothetical protein